MWLQGANWPCVSKRRVSSCTARCPLAHTQAANVRAKRRRPPSGRHQNFTHERKTSAQAPSHGENLYAWRPQSWINYELISGGWLDIRNNAQSCHFTTTSLCVHNGGSSRRTLTVYLLFSDFWPFPLPHKPCACFCSVGAVTCAQQACLWRSSTDMSIF